MYKVVYSTWKNELLMTLVSFASTTGLKNYHSPFFWLVYELLLVAGVFSCSYYSGMKATGTVYLMLLCVVAEAHYPTVSLCLLHGPDSSQPFLCGPQSSGD